MPDVSDINLTIQLELLQEIRRQGKVLMALLEKVDMIGRLVTQIAKDHDSPSFTNSVKAEMEAWRERLKGPTTQDHTVYDRSEGEASEDSSGLHSRSSKSGCGLSRSRSRSPRRSSATNITEHEGSGSGANGHTHS